MKHHLLIITVLFVLLQSCSNKKIIENDSIDKNEKEAVTDKPAEVKAMLMELTDFNYELMSNGTVEAIRKADLRFQSQEVISKVYVKNGLQVEAGQMIAELDKYKLESSLRSAQDAKDRALLDLQDVLIGQGYKLKDSINIPDNVMKIAKIRSNYDQSINNYSIAKYNLEQSTLRAPFKGVIANLWNKEHNYPSGEVFCTVLDNKNFEILFHVLETEINLIKLNDKILASPFSTSDYVVEGHITEINPSVGHNGMIRVKATIPNKESKIYEGMNVKVRVQRLLGKQLVVPKSALLLRSNRKIIFTLKNDRAMWNYVETAQENSESYVVTEGINVGDSVIYEGNINLAHESPVIIK